ncbi:RHS repeat-associated core domain-containing protein [Pseudomonas sp. BW13M1]|uniref:RHS repeat-associated core domain-containing protein n=1 Tax=Pseudomonas peradeniyensis TaxID=2745488 RepID=A0A923G7P8_9PSED|nr:RHS repeat-associated core domain-containing protein [Pseudomonas peradeniyensis]MBV4507408.1 RHS repeat-associated core domain-containing protein [Pseudomonas peradeniyensis]
MAHTHLSRTDRQQSVLGETRAYPPYGASSLLTGARLAYCGQLREPVTGTYHLGNGHRVFNPLIMRFSSPDRLSPFGKGGMNTYVYCQGDPINYQDPSGRTLSRSEYKSATNTLSAFAAGVGAADLFGHIKQRAAMSEYIDLREELIKLGVPERELGAPVRFWDKRKQEATIVTDGAAAGVVVAALFFQDLDSRPEAVHEPDLLRARDILIPLAALATMVASKITNNVLGVNKRDFVALAEGLQKKKDDYYNPSLLGRAGNLELSELGRGVREA